MTTIDLEEFLRESGIEFRSLEQWVERRWIVPARAEADMELSDVDAARALLIRDLRSDFGVNDEGVEIVLHLVDQVHSLRRALLSLRTELHMPPRDPPDAPTDEES
jgi:chaperone modulatory protein CbpM